MPAPAPSASFGVADVKLPGWNAAQLERAVQSLLKYVGQQKENSTSLLADEDEMLYLQLSLKTMPLQPRKDKPVRLPLPHPLYTPDGAEICLIVKDHEGEGHKETKKRLERFERKGGVTKVVGISKLKTKYESHESKRELCKLYDLFLADERVLSMLPKLIGKSFFKKKKQPIPVDLTAKDFPAQVVKACGATYLYRNSGTCINLRVARSSFGAEGIAQNLYAALVQAVDHLPKKWSNVQGVFLKTADSVALPIFQTLPDAPSRIHANGSAPVAARQPPKKQQEQQQKQQPAVAAVAAVVAKPAPAAKAPTPAPAVAPAAAPVAKKAAAPAVKKAAAAAPAAPAPAAKRVAPAKKAPAKQPPAKAATAGTKRAASAAHAAPAAKRKQP